MTRKILFFSLVLLIQTSFASEQKLKQLASNSDDMSLPAIQQRLEPVGEVRTTADTSKTPAPQNSAQPSATVTETPEVKVVTRSGKTVYEQYCVVCHGEGVAGAPKFHSAEDWKPRETKGMDGLLKSAINGLNAMPPRGSCPDCSDAELKAAIEYMQPK